jgi:hypothetical protein
MMVLYFALNLAIFSDCILLGCFTIRLVFFEEYLCSNFSAVDTSHYFSFLIQCLLQSFEQTPYIHPHNTQHLNFFSGGYLR